jgi:hypothetical protein
VLSSEVVPPAGTDWGALVGAGIGAVGTLLGVIIGGRSGKRADAEAVRRTAYAGYLTAVAPLLSLHKQQRADEVSQEDWRNLRAARYAAELVGSTRVANSARRLSVAVNEPQPLPEANFDELFGELIRAMKTDLEARRRRRWLGRSS